MRPRIHDQEPAYPLGDGRGDRRARPRLEVLAHPRGLHRLAQRREVHPEEGRRRGAEAREPTVRVGRVDAHDLGAATGVCVAAAHAAVGGRSEHEDFFAVSFVDGVLEGPVVVEFGGGPAEGHGNYVRFPFADRMMYSLVIKVLTLINNNGAFYYLLGRIFSAIAHICDDLYVKCRVLPVNNLRDVELEVWGIVENQACGEGTMTISIENAFLGRVMEVASRSDSATVGFKFRVLPVDASVKNSDFDGIGDSSFVDKLSVDLVILPFPLPIPLTVAPKGQHLD